MEVKKITSTITVESTHGDWTFSGTVEVYNKQKAIKCIHCTVVKKGQATPAMPAMGNNYYYNVSRGSCSNMSMGTAIPDNEIGNEILEAGLIFEKELQDGITAGTLTETV